MAFTHQDTAENDELDGSETELSCTQQGHAHDVATSLQLTVGLYLNLVTQTVEHEGLLGLSQTNLRRDAGIANGRGRTSARAAFSTADDHDVGFGFGNTGSDGSYPTLGHEFHADLSTWVHVLQVENQLSQVLDAVDIVMRWR